MSVKAPAFQFYPADWRKDIELQSCSIAARGLWIELICLMHQAQPYGKLMVNSKQIDDKTAAKLIGIDRRKYQKLLQELLQNGVARKDEEGTIYSKRMVADYRLRQIRREAGSKGGNPDLVNQKDKQNEKQKPTPSSSSSTSSSTKEQEDKYSQVFDCWIGSGLQKHRKFTDQMKTKIRSAENQGYTIEDICQAIQNYATVLHTPALYYFDHSWPLEHFLARGLVQFVNEATPLSNFLRNKNKEAIPENGHIFI